MGDHCIVERVRTTFDIQPVVDMHTHLYAPAFDRGAEDGDERLLLYGIDELLAYHYFVDEVFRVLEPGSLTPAAFWAMPTPERADLVWRNLFVERPPVSEACVGLIDILTSLGLDPAEPDLAGYRSWFAARDIDTHIDEVMRLSGVERIVMTNEPFSDLERPRWEAGVDPDPRFAAVVRVDPIVEQWPSACERLAAWGYDVREDLSGQTTAEVRRFLDEWIERTSPVYLACSLSPAFRYASDGDAPSIVRRLFDECLVRAAREHGLMLALMIGAKRAVHPEMRLAGDGLGRADVDQVAALARTHQDVTFLITMLSRENQHELCVAARKFSNLLPFGCWWYVNTTSQIREITRTRLELLGTSFIPQHSDARVLEQLIYKWRQSRRLIADCVAERYVLTEAAGARVTDAAIKADAERLLRGNFVERVAGWTAG
ncbi:MAG: glucuronate isomerase [Phycisphaerae bacterium]|nr:glucuronate isomerase [Phycisphaerae bacterium]